MDQHLSCIIIVIIIIIIIIIIMAKTAKKTRFFRHLVLSLTKTVKINELSLLVPLKSS